MATAAAGMVEELTRAMTGDAAATSHAPPIKSSCCFLFVSAILRCAEKLAGKGIAEGAVRGWERGGEFVRNKNNIE